MGSGVNDSRRTFLALLTDPQIDPVVLAHQDRATCFGFRYFETLLELSSRGFEVAHLAKTDREELLQERSRIVSAMGARRYGPRRAKTQRELIGHRLAPGQE
jgi:predicted site-specific integrase-resolvase